MQVKNFAKLLKTLAVSKAPQKLLFKRQPQLAFKNFNQFCFQMPQHTTLKEGKGLEATLIRNEQKNYLVQQFYTSCLAEATYYIQSGNEVAIVDPLRDTAPYIQLAEQNGAKIKYILMTHFHADYVSGHEDLALKTGAQIIYGPNAQPQFQAHIAQDNEILPLGDVQIKVLHTPGHTMESSTFLLQEGEQNPQAIFTGDTLFLGEVGRPDLAVKSGEITSEDLGSYLYDSLQQKILPLPDSTLVYPGHGPGSPCGKAIQPGTYDNLGNQRKSNYALQFDNKADFVASVTSGLPTPPAYFFHDVGLNKSGGSSNIDQIVENNNRALNISEFSDLVENQGYTVIDTRQHLTFLGGFIPKSFNVDLSQSFALWVGKLITPDKKFVLICENGQEKEAVIRLCRIGYDNVKGYLEGGIQAWQNAGKEVQVAELISAKDFEQVYNNSNNLQSLDVRNIGEFEGQAMEKSKNIPLWELEDAIEKNENIFDKNQKVYVNCARGARAVSGVSILAAHGYKQVASVDGGLAAVQQDTNIKIKYE